MKKIYTLITLLLAFLLSSTSFKANASCSPGYSEIIIQIIPDSWPQEISWTLVDGSSTLLASGDFHGDTICVPSSSCVLFSIHDAYGDGIIAPGGYWIYVDGIQVAHGDGSTYAHDASHSIACPPGSWCTSPILLSSFGNYTANYEDTWYVYTCTNTGTYNVSTCGMNTCDTKIWVYTSCPMAPYNEGAPGTEAYNDNAGCGLQADLNVMFIAGHTYYIRIGDNLNDCTDSIGFSFSYVGPVQGCMDVSACNYNPLAAIDDGSCIYYPNPLCAGPDLRFDSVAFVTSLSMSSVTAQTCDIVEGCLLDYGVRHVIKFTSRINNIGTLPYVIGNPSANPSMFNTTNCHGHTHYEGYGDYRLFDMDDHLIPAGHKNGFCVMDVCGGPYNCSNMGISVGGCDIYGAGTQCQWVDVTDVSDGDYRLAILVNPLHLSDAMGHPEMNYVNNATQVCIHLQHDSLTNVQSYTLLPTCEPFTDCFGIPGGAAVMDCEGVCNGTSVFGDVLNDTHLDSLDIPMYMSIIQDGTLTASSCNDLSGDGNLTIYDAALANWCIHNNTVSGNTHNHCQFPRNIFNPGDSASLTITAANFTQGYVDIALNSLYTDISAFQFTMHGITIQSVVSLVDPTDFPVDIRFSTSTNEVLAVSLVDSFIHRSVMPIMLCRIYYSLINDTAICISHITDIVNRDAERIVANVEGGCIESLPTGITSIMKSAALAVIPNPATDRAMVHVDQNVSAKHINVYDLNGKSFDVHTRYVKDNWYSIDLSNLPQGVYMIRVDEKDVRGIARLIKL